HGTAATSDATANDRAMKYVPRTARPDDRGHFRFDGEVTCSPLLGFGERGKPDLNEPSRERFEKDSEEAYSGRRANQSRTKRSATRRSRYLPPDFAVSSATLASSCFTR